jgi:hypothetical protein
MLMAVGGLIAALCGTCTLVMFGTSVASMFTYTRDVAAAVVALLYGGVVIGIFGGVPTLVGVLVFRAGWRRYRPARRLRPAELAAFSDEPPESPS